MLDRKMDGYYILHKEYTNETLSAHPFFYIN